LIRVRTVLLRRRTEILAFFDHHVQTSSAIVEHDIASHAHTGGLIWPCSSGRTEMGMKRAVAVGSGLAGLSAGYRPYQLGWQVTV